MQVNGITITYDGVGDICSIGMLMNGKRARLVSVYILFSPNSKMLNVRDLFELNTMAYIIKAVVVDVV